MVIYSILQAPPNLSDDPASRPETTVAAVLPQATTAMIPQATTANETLAPAKHTNPIAATSLDFVSMQRQFLSKLNQDDNKKDKKVKGQSTCHDKSRLNPMPQSPEYKGSRVLSIFNVTGLKLKDK